MGDTIARRSPASTGRTLTAEDGMPVATLVLPREPQSAAAARQFVTHTLAHWQLEHLTDTAALVVTELSANAIQHDTRHAVFRVTLRRRPNDRVRVAVIDKSTIEPVLRRADDDAETGRGLALVDSIALRWGTDPLGWGKRVWADVGAPRPKPSRLDGQARQDEQGPALGR